MYANDFISNVYRGIGRGKEISTLNVCLEKEGLFFLTILDLIIIYLSLEII